jgi:DNA polymerase-3 subunit delta'|tara:strand:- start:1846 stop:2835 length:990 start_codon:yes stop_codon:yes gene_type:complete
MDLQSENYSSPRETYNFIGNDRLVDFLVFSEENNRLHHAYLLSGDKGIGKATFAYNFARYLFNNKKNNFSKIDRDNKHSRLIESRSHPDLFVIEIDKESKKNKIDVNQVRECIDFFNYTTALCNYKICIIDSLDEMNLNAANAILKVLEEPPDNSLFLVISQSPKSLIPTIRSRCLELRFERLKDDLLFDYLKQTMPDIEGDSIKEVVKISQGSLGRALMFFNEEIKGINENTKNLFSNSDNIDIYEFCERLLKNNNHLIKDFFEFLLFHLESLIKEESLKRINFKNKKLLNYFLLREELQSMILQEKYFNADKRQIILNLILKTKEIS